jgi:hypothetical protein
MPTWVRFAFAASWLVMMAVTFYVKPGQLVLSAVMVILAVSQLAISAVVRSRANDPAIIRR